MSLSVVFMGTPKFAIPSMEALNDNFDVKAVVTAPDKPKGRGHKLLPCEVKERALELGLQVLQPENLRDEEFIGQLKEINPDIIVVVAFRILPKEVYTLPKLACFNIHGSLLPKFRGAAPINHAIISGEQITGLTSFLLQEKVDTGDVLLQSIIEVPENATAGDLHDLLSPLAAKLTVDTCNLIKSGNFKAIPQNNSEASPAPKVFSYSAEIDFSQNAEKVKNFIHGHSPVPGAWTLWNGKTLKIFRAVAQLCECSVIDKYPSLAEPNDFVIDKDCFIVKCGQGIIFIDEMQIEGKKHIKTIDFLRGYKGEKTGKFEKKVK